MTNQQLYLAIGLPILVYLLGFTTTFVVMALQARSLRDTMQAQFSAVQAEFGAVREALMRVEQVADARIKWLEERAK